MAKMRRAMTFSEFWGELLLVRFHGKGEEFRRFNEQRAQWVWHLLPASAETSPRILDLGCGSGILDICLAQRGAQVTAVDRIGPVLDIARRQAEAAGITDQIDFRHENLEELTLPSAAFDLVLMLGLVGLMSPAADAALIAHSRRWLDSGGRLLVDCPREPEAPTNQWTRDIDEGVLDFRSEYNPVSRLQHLTPTFHRPGEAIIELFDPYDATRPGAA
ncbi:MAG: class I SAM-dependent methyltransferase, partial [Abitibacteriaceae bacterium]|nr:class I SAM-dependent methyltransferase [Abditibacteriaceae bacterium]